MPSYHPLSTSTALLCRLFARFEGAGELMASVPLGMEDLSSRLGGQGVDKRFGREYRRVFPVSEEAREYVKSVMGLSSSVLAADRRALGEVLDRVALSGLETRPLRKEELAHLQRWIGEGNWCKGISVWEH